MLFNYRVATKTGEQQEGSIDAPNSDLAITALQRRGFMVIAVNSAEKTAGLRALLPFGGKVRSRDIVLLSRQIATLFEAKVSALTSFRLLATESENVTLQVKLTAVTDDIKGGMPISAALAKHPDVFSEFYVAMVKSGEETGKISEAFNYLADYTERSYALTARATNALIYPAFVVASFIVVMILMMTFVIPKLSVILEDTGQALPIYTRIVVGTSNFFVNYGLILLVFLIIAGIFLARYLPTTSGKIAFSRLKLALPYFGRLYSKLYLSRIADNLNTMLTSGISSIRALEITAGVVDNEVFRDILNKTADSIKGGMPMSAAFAKFPEIPGIMIQMLKVGEETGQTGFVLSTMSRFYQREVSNEIDTVVSLIEPVMIVLLGLGVGLLLTAVLVPIYNVAASL